MRDINRHVINDHAPRWEQIGRILNVKGLTVIALNCRHPTRYTQECFSSTLTKWLQADIEATWQKLENALNQAIRDEVGDIEEPAKGTYTLL